MGNGSGGDGRLEDARGERGNYVWDVLYKRRLY